MYSPRAAFCFAFDGHTMTIILLVPECELMCYGILTQRFTKFMNTAEPLPHTCNSILPLLCTFSMLLIIGTNDRKNGGNFSRYINMVISMVGIIYSIDRGIKREFRLVGIIRNIINNLKRSINCKNSFGQCCSARPTKSKNFLSQTKTIQK